MKKVLKIIGLIFGGIILVGILIELFTPQSVKDERRRHAKANLDSVTWRIASLRDALPDPEGEIVAQQFPNDTIDWKEMATLSVDEIDYFNDTTLFVDRPLGWGPWQSEWVGTFEQTYLTLANYRNPLNQIDHGDELLRKKRIMVFWPFQYSPPKLVDKETFLPGYFDGLMIYMDFQQPKTLGFTRFQAFTRKTEFKGETLGIGLGPLPVGIPLANITDFEKELYEDFRKEFFHNADSVFRGFQRK